MQAVADGETAKLRECQEELRQVQKDRDELYDEKFKHGEVLDGKDE